MNGTSPRRRRDEDVTSGKTGQAMPIPWPADSSASWVVRRTVPSCFFNGLFKAGRAGAVRLGCVGVGTGYGWGGRRNFLYHRYCDPLGVSGSRLSGRTDGSGPRYHSSGSTQYGFHRSGSSGYCRRF